MGSSPQVGCFSPADDVVVILTVSQRASRGKIRTKSSCRLLTCLVTQNSNSCNNNSLESASTTGSTAIAARSRTLGTRGIATDRRATQTIATATDKSAPHLAAAVAQAHVEVAHARDSVDLHRIDTVRALRVRALSVVDVYDVVEDVRSRGLKAKAADRFIDSAPNAQTAVRPGPLPHGAKPTAAEKISGLRCQGGIKTQPCKTPATKIAPRFLVHPDPLSASRPSETGQSQPPVLA